MVGKFLLLYSAIYVFFIPQCAKAKVASPAALTAANVMVTALPKSMANSLMIRPKKPMATRIKPVNLTISFMDIP